MKTREFIEQLRGSRSRQVLFVDENDTTIHGGYHLTELKAATFDTVDCGGQKNRWHETIVQLWVPEDEESDEFMTADKFLSIYDRVSGMIALDPEAEIRFEYGDENFVPSNYHVAKVTKIADTIWVELRPPQATCKARDRREAGAACCG
jgi:Family of unknown function (DUF6428)